MKRIAGLLVVVAMISGCAGVQTQPTEGPTEGLGFTIPKEYKPKFTKNFTVIPEKMWVTKIVFDGKSIGNWTEALDIIHTKRKDSPPTTEDGYNVIVNKAKEVCPGSIFSVISKDNNSLLFEKKAINCPPEPDENTIERILHSDRNVFILTYTNKVKDLPKEIRDKWIEVLSEAKIETR